MVPQCGFYPVEGLDYGPHSGTDVPEFIAEPLVAFLLLCLDLGEPGQYRRHRLLGVVVCSHDGVYCAFSQIFVVVGVCGAAVCTANGIPRLKDRRVDSWVRMAWACLCWRGGGGLVISSLSLPADEAAFRGCRVFGGFTVGGQNDRGGLPQLRR
ncbi:hypothetical protein NDU88_005110 [Pleurodeles waltl]|uniref:Uncharacterized protein n=1 Tax=Pleurodeles waltl TaxID=8319 RepID=A0AAV7TTU2_PLEWA|nr:hypothetical protein NDU88_005110 [Pleurodeles waltl]